MILQFKILFCTALLPRWANDKYKTLEEYTELKMLLLLKRRCETHCILKDIHHNRQNNARLYCNFAAPSPIFPSLWHLLG